MRPLTRPSATLSPLTRGEGHSGRSPREPFSLLAGRRCREAADEGQTTCAEVPWRSARQLSARNVSGFMAVEHLLLNAVPGAGTCEHGGSYRKGMVYMIKKFALVSLLVLSLAGYAIASCSTLDIITESIPLFFTGQSCIVQLEA